MTRLVAVIPWGFDLPLTQEIADSGVGCPVRYWLGDERVGTIVGCLAEHNEDGDRLVVTYEVDRPEALGALSLECRPDRVLDAAFIPAMRVRS